MKARMLLLFLSVALASPAGPSVPAVDWASPSPVPVLPILGVRSLVTSLHRSDRSMGPDPWTVIEPLKGPRKAFGLPVRQTGPDPAPPPIGLNGPLHRRVRDTGLDGPPLG